MNRKQAHLEWIIGPRSAGWPDGSRWELFKNGELAGRVVAIARESGNVRACTLDIYDCQTCTDVHFPDMHSAARWLESVVKNGA